MIRGKSSIVAFRSAQPATAAELRTREARRPIDADGSMDFSDAESLRVLDAAAQALASELGRQAAREFWAVLVRGGQE